MCSTCKQHFIWIYYTTIYPCKMNSVLPCHFQPVGWICSWGLFWVIPAGLHRGLSSGCCCVPGQSRGGNHSLGPWVLCARGQTPRQGWESLTGLFSGPASWQEGPDEAPPTPGSWKNRRRPEDLALMSSGSSREGSLKVQEPFWLL